MLTKLTHLILAVVVPIVIAGCATVKRGAGWQQGTTTITISGRQGIPFTGYYVIDGKHFDFTSAVPFSLAVPGLSEAVIRKVDPDHSLTVEARLHRDETQLNFSSTAGPAIPGVRIQVRNGLSVENLKQ